jgi:DNA repair photolyase
MGWHSDPYQPCEAECRQTRQVLELLLRQGFSASILTKSDLVLRDLDLLKSMEDSAVSFSVAFNDDDIRQLFEANTKTTEARISALQHLRTAGIRTTALICPVVPCITDVIDFIDRLAGYTEKIWIYALSIQDKADITWQNVENILDHHFPDLKGKIESAIFDKNNPYWENLRQDILDIEKAGRVNLSVHI